MKKNQKRILNYILIMAVVILSLFLVWVLKVKDLSIPIEHRTSYVEHEFDITVGKIRQIDIRDLVGQRRETRVFRLRIEIYDEAGDIVWQKDYDKQEYGYDFNTVDQFGREDALELNPGTYTVQCYYNDKPVDWIIVNFIEYNGTPNKLYFGLCVLIVIAMAITLFVAEFESLKPEITYLALAITLGMVSLIAFAPMSMGDEVFHFREAYSLSDDMVYMFTDREEGNYVRADDLDSLEYLHNIAGISGWYASWEKGNVDDKVPIFEDPAVTSRAKYVYLFSSLGITVSRALRLSGHALLMMGEVFNLIVVALIIAMAIRLMPWGKWYFCIVGLLPEVLYFSSSYSYDGINLALCMLISSYFMYLAFEKSKIEIKDIVIYCVFLLLMLPIKTIYVAFAALLLLLPAEKLSMTKRTKTILVVGGITGIMLIAGFIAYKTQYLFAGAGIYKNNPNGMYTLRHVLDHPIETMHLYLDSFLYDTPHIFGASMGELIARARCDGRMNYLMPGWMQVSIIALMIIMLQDTAQNGLSKTRRIIVVVLGIGTAFAVNTAMLFSDTTLNNWKIAGTQGRYFIPIYALVPLMICNKTVHISVDKRKFCIWGMSIINILFVVLALYYGAYNYFADL